jgi:serine/threonine protein kinase
MIPLHKRLMSKKALKNIGVVFLIGCFTLHPLNLKAQSQSLNSEFISLSSENHYEFLSLLGKGEKSEVYLAKDRSGHLFAIKCMYSKRQLRKTFSKEERDAMFDSDGSSRLAKREVLISQQLNHPSILKIKGFYTIVDKVSGEKRDCLVMEYVQGETLNKTPEKSQTNQMARQNALALIDALKVAFSQHWIHHDLYSSNIMYDENKHIKLIDIDSFDPLTNGNEEPSQVEYLKGVVLIIQKVLERGNFDENSLHLMSKRLNDVLYASSYAEQLQESISPQSIPLLLQALGDMAQSLNPS